MPEPVNIPVQVTGAEQAKAELQQLGAAVEQTGQTAAGARAARLTGGDWDAGKKAMQGQAALQALAQGTAVDAAAQAQEKLNAATDRGIFAQEGYSRASRGMIGHILGVVNPALGQTFLVLSELYHGFTRMTTTMLGLAGAGAALGVIVAIFQSIAEAARKAEEAIKRVNDARREAAGQALELRKQVADAAKDAGVLGGGPAATDTAINLMHARGGRGVERELAVFGGVAQQVAVKAIGRPLTDDEVRQVIGASLATGQEDKFVKSDAANARTLRKLLAIPAERSAAALAARQWDVGIPTGNEKPTTATTAAEQLRAVALERMKDTGKFSKEELEIAERLAKGDEPGQFVSAGDTAGSAAIQSITNEPQNPWARTARGSERTLEQLLGALKAEMGAVRSRSPENGGLVTVNVYHSHDNRTQIGTNYGAPPPSRSSSVMSPDGF